MKPLVIGEAPGKHGDPTKPLEGRTGARLAAFADVSLEEFLDAFERINLLDVQPQDSGKGMPFNAKAAGRIARRVEDTAFASGRIILLLGKRVGGAFRLTNIEYFKKIVLGSGAIVYVIPHPSGINRWFNVDENRRVMGDFMRYVVRAERLKP